MVTIQRLSPQRLRSEVDALVYSQRDATIPDVIAYSDYCAARDVAAHALTDEIVWTSEVGNPDYVLVPKGSTGVRRVTVLDPLREIVYRLHSRAFVGRRIVLSERVLSAQVDFSGSTWRSCDYRAGQKRKREIEESWVERFPNRGMGRIDIREFFPTIQTPEISRVAASLRVDDSEIAGLIEFLRKLQSCPAAPTGLPIGPNASAPIGTVYLATLDRVLDRLEVEWIRWVDDVSIGGLTERAFEEVVGHLDDHLALRGQTLNHAKTQMDWNPVFLSESSGASAEPTGDDLDGDHLLSTLESASLTSDLSEVPRALAGLGKLKDERALELVIDDSHAGLAARLPQQTVRLVSKFPDSELAREWALTTALQNSDKKDEALQIHAARLAASWAQRERASADQAWSTADSISPGEGRTRRAFTYRLASCLEPDVKRLRRRTLDRVAECSDVNTNRALLCRLREVTPSRVERNWIRDQSVQRPELHPIASLIVSS